MLQPLIISFAHSKLIVVALLRGNTMDVKKRILELMDKRGWTKYRLSKETGIYITTINDWFNGKGYTPSRESIVSICEAMGITVAEFYGGIEEHDLTNEQLVLLEKFEKVPKDRRKMVFDLMEVLSKEKS